MMWYKKAAEAGNNEGMKNYARALETGLDGSEPNLQEAEIWYKKAEE
jgi:TPR repeat protein